MMLDWQTKHTRKQLENAIAENKRELMVSHCIRSRETEARRRISQPLINLRNLHPPKIPAPAPPPDH